MKQLPSGFLILCLLVAAIVASAANSGSASQEAVPSNLYLPDPSVLRGDWMISDEGERTKSEVAAGIGADGDELLTAWRWRENFYRDLTRNDSNVDSAGAAFISVSIHRFAGGEGAAAALDYFPDLVMEVQQLNEVSVPRIGEQSRAVAGPGDGVNLYVLFIQQGRYYLRFGGSSVDGDPSTTIIELAKHVIAGMQSGTASSVSPQADIADGCWTSDQRILSSSGEMSFLTEPNFVLDPSLQYFADFHTSRGDFQVRLHAGTAAEEVNNFVCLANAGFYNGTLFFRTLPGLLIQGGDPTGTGTGGPGYNFGDAAPGFNDYSKGVIAYANPSPDRNGSQFFIAASDLTGSIATDFPVFGEVIDGMDVVSAIAETDVQATFASPAADSGDFVVLESVAIVAHAPVAGPFISPTAVATVAPTAAAEEINLIAKDIAFDPTEITIAASDLPVTITMENTGAAEHDFVIDALDIKVAAAPGETVEIVIPAGTAPGEYQYYCSVPGHKEAGMVGTLTVE